MNGTATPGSVSAPSSDVPTPNELAAPGVLGGDTIADNGGNAD